MFKVSLRTDGLVGTSTSSFEAIVSTGRIAVLSVEVEMSGVETSFGLWMSV